MSILLQDFGGREDETGDELGGGRSGGMEDWEGNERRCGGGWKGWVDGMEEGLGGFIGGEEGSC